MGYTPWVNFILVVHTEKALALKWTPLGIARKRIEEIIKIEKNRKKYTYVHMVGEKKKKYWET